MTLRPDRSRAGCTIDHVFVRTASPAEQGANANDFRNREMTGFEVAQIAISRAPTAVVGPSRYSYRRPTPRLLFGICFEEVGVEAVGAAARRAAAFAIRPRARR